MLEFSTCKGDVSSYLNVLSSNARVRGMLGGKHYQSVDGLSLFVAALMFLATGSAHDAPMTFVHTNYSMLDSV